MLLLSLFSEETLYCGLKVLNDLGEERDGVYGPDGPASYPDSMVFAEVIVY